MQVSNFSSGRKPYESKLQHLVNASVNTTLPKCCVKFECTSVYASAPIVTLPFAVFGQCFAAQRHAQPMTLIRQVGAEYLPDPICGRAHPEPELWQGAP